MLLFIILFILLLLLSYLWFRLSRFYRRMSARYEQRMRPVFVPVATLVVAAAIILFVPFWTVQIQVGPVSENVASTKEPGYIVVAERKEHGQSLWNVLKRLIGDEDREEALKTGSITFELANLTQENTRSLFLGIVFVATFLLVTAVFGICFGILQDEVIERDLDIMPDDDGRL